MDIVSFYTAAEWDAEFTEHERRAAITDLESGKILYFPQLGFPHDQPFFLPYAMNKKTKNISFNIQTGELRGLQANRNHHVKLKLTMQRFSQLTKNLVSALFPRYADQVITGRTSYRPAQIKNRKSSARKDDSRLHVDAFPANPNQGNRILRVFSNINPYGESRVWRIGEPFSQVAKRFLPKISKPLPGSAKFFHWAGITKSRRTYYDHIMLQMHDRMKLDNNYQKQVKFTEICFPPNTSWIVSTDQVSHAAISGQYILEQTFYLPVAAMQNPELAPLHILENLLGRSLI
jgi:hypothetical protein